MGLTPGLALIPGLLLSLAATASGGETSGRLFLIHSYAPNPWTNGIRVRRQLEMENFLVFRQLKMETDEMATG